MTLYIYHTGKLQEIKEKPFKLEKDIQELFEANLSSIMGLELVKSEFTVKNKRIDTLAFNPQTKSFTIIEYKRNKNTSVVDQGFAYLGLMLENKGEFIVEYNESLKKNLKRQDVDWSQTRVAFVSTGFTENQLRATNFKDIGIELWEIKQFENGSIIVNSIKKSADAPSIKPIAQNKEAFKTVANEIKVYTEEAHLDEVDEAMAELYLKLRDAIFQLADGIETRPKKMEIGFTRNGKVFTDIHIQKKALKIWINLRKGKLDDPRKLAEDVSGRGHWGNGDYQLQVSDARHLEYIMSLIKQAL